MKRSILFTMLVALVLCAVPPLIWAAKVGEAAPEFTASASNGKTYRLSDYRGKYVVLEWHNNGCPYVGKHYNSGNMQRLQKQWTSRGVVWFTILSSAPGKQGYVTGPGADDLTRTRGASPTAVLLDSAGTVGRLYHAKTTPHLFVIDRNGELQYMGGIDSIASVDVSDIGTAEPYLKEAMVAVVQGQSVAHPVTRPYGCSVKY